MEEDAPARPDVGEIRTAVLAGALAGFSAALVFATAHAIIIVPIWTRMAWGVFFAVLAGMVGGWGFAALRFPPRGERVASWAAHASSGIRFGALLWLAIVPVTLVDSLLRLSGLRRPELLEVIVAVAVAIVTGALLGAIRVGTRHAKIAGAASTLALTIAMAGPVPIVNGPRALTIFLATLPAALVAGLTLGLTLRVLRHRRAPSPSGREAPA